MSMLFRIIYATKANGTHHKLAMDALRHLDVGAADQWRRLFLKHVDLYLEGAKAPDREFKDFKNHVLHVGDEFWGGAPIKAQAWYDKLVRALAQQQFEEAVYCAGVLSHYYTDPLQPFHTAQSEAENNMHRAVEWSINKSYNMLRKKGLRDYAGLAVEPDSDDDWLQDLVRRGAVRSHHYYDALISNYNLDQGVVDPLDGLNENCHRFLSELIVYASIGYARILDRAFLQAAVSPPDVNLTLDTFVASLAIPIRWVLRTIEDAEDRAAVQAAYDELQSTGRVEEHLSEDDRMVRNLHRQEVLDRRAIKQQDDPLEQLKRNHNRQKMAAARQHEAAALRVSVPPVVAKEEAAQQTTGSLNGPRLTLQDDVERGPSIGRKTAARLYAVEVHSVADLLAADPSDLASKLDHRWIKAQTVRDWQDQARLMCEIAGLRISDSQLLVAVNLRTAQDITALSADEIQSLIALYCQTKEGKGLRSCENPPETSRIESWIDAAEQPVSTLAA
jgi:hypothetical protein